MIWLNTITVVHETIGSNVDLCAMLVYGLNGRGDTIKTLQRQLFTQIRQYTQDFSLAVWGLEWKSR